MKFNLVRQGRAAHKCSLLPPLMSVLSRERCGGGDKLAAGSSLAVAGEDPKPLVQRLLTGEDGAGRKASKQRWNTPARVLMLLMTSPCPTLLSAHLHRSAR